jgi:iron(III) transport system permease protein
VVLIYSLVAYVVVRSKLASAGVVDLLAWLPWGTPGILLRLGLLWLFLTTPLRTLLYGTLGGIVVALLLKESPASTQLRDIRTSVLLYSPQSRPLSILMLEYSFSGELERGSGVGILITTLVMALMLAARWWTHRQGASS